MHKKGLLLKILNILTEYVRKKRWAALGGDRGGRKVSREGIWEVGERKDWEMESEETFVLRFVKMSQSDKQDRPTDHCSRFTPFFLSSSCFSSIFHHVGLCSTFFIVSFTFSPFYPPFLLHWVFVSIFYLLLILHLKPLFHLSLSVFSPLTFSSLFCSSPFHPGFSHFFSFTFMFSFLCVLWFVSSNWASSCCCCASANRVLYVLLSILYQSQDIC